MTQTYRRTGNLATIMGLEEGHIYRVTSTSNGIALEELEAAIILPQLTPIQLGQIYLDAATFTARVENINAHLTRHEWQLLTSLLHRIGQGVPSAILLSETWGTNYVEDVEYLRVWISRLRQKLPGLPLKTIHGIGYRLESNGAT